jgi:hypothetical protein
MAEHTEKEYRNDVQTIAEDALEQLRADHKNELADESIDLDDLDPSEMLHESVDSSQWIIYTYQAELVVTRYSSNRDMYCDHVDAQDFEHGIPWSVMAFYAMLEDVNSVYSDLVKSAMSDDSCAVRFPITSYP